MSEPQADSVLAYERKFVPALAWSVRGAMLQFGGRMTIVEDDGRVAYHARGANALMFVAILFGLLCVLTLVGPIALEIYGVSWFPRRYHGYSTLLGGMMLGAAILCYMRAMATFKIALLRDNEPVAWLTRGDVIVGERPNWHIADINHAVVGRIGAAYGELQIFDHNGLQAVTVAGNKIPGMDQALWRRISRTGSTARGRLRIGMGAGARLEIDDDHFELDPRLLAALLLSVAIEGK